MSKKNVNKNASYMKVLTEKEFTSLNKILLNLMTAKNNKIQNDSWYEADLTNDELQMVKLFTEGFCSDDCVKSVRSAAMQVAEKIISYAKSWYEYQYADSNPISDGLYDRLIAQFKAFGGIEPTGVIPAATTSKSTEIKNPILHNNLDKCYRIYESEDIPEGTAEKTSVESWLSKMYDALSIPKTQKLKLMLAHKLDGVSVIADIDDNGKITAAQSRGDESKAMSMPGLEGIQLCDDSFVGCFRPCTIQFEMFCTNEQRDAAPNVIGIDRMYKSNRSAASAIRKRLESGHIDGVENVISLYPILGDQIQDEDGNVVTNYEDVIDFVQNFAKFPKDIVGMQAPSYIEGDYDSLLDSINEYFKNLTEIRETLNYPIDGMVITLPNEEAQSVIGRDNRTNRYQIAMKFNPAFADGVVDHVYLSAGNKGFRTVMVVLEHPVFIDGAEYPEVQVLSAGQFEELGLTEKCSVRVHRTGDVIPRLTKLKDGDGAIPIKLPTHCPSCGFPLSIEARKLKCDNPKCPENVAGIIRYFFSILNIEGYSDAFANRLIDAGYDTPVKIMKLTKEDLANAGITGKREDQFVDVIQNAIASARDYRLLASLGLPGLGVVTAKKLCSILGLKYIANADATDLYLAIQTMPGFDTKAPKLAAHLTEARSEVKEIMHILLPQNVTRVGSTTINVGHTGVSLPKDLVDWINKVGYDVTDGASFDLLVVGDKKTTSRKMQRAQKRNLPVFTVDEMINELKKRYYYQLAAKIASNPNNIVNQAAALVPAN